MRLCHFIAFVCLSLQVSAQVQDVPGEKALMDKGQQLLRSGRAAEAVPIGEERLALVQKALGKSSAAVVPAMESLANYCLESGDAARARKLFTDAMAINRKAHGSDDGWLFSSLVGLGRLEAREGNYTVSQGLLERAVKAAEKLFGKSDPLTATTLEDLAQTRVHSGDNAGAVTLFERVLHIRRESLGEEHAGVANAMLNLAIAQQRLGHLSEAEDLLQKAVTLHTKVSGPEHPSTAIALSQLGEFYRAMGDNQMAEFALEKALAIKLKILGPAHPGTIIAMHGLATVKISRQQWTEAEALYRQAATAAEQTHGKKHVMTARINAGFASALAHLGKHEEAITRCRESIAVLEELQGAESVDLFDPLSHLAQALMATKQFAEAEQTLRRASDVAVKTQGANSENTFTAMSNLIWCLHAEAKDSEASSLGLKQLEHSCQRWQEMLSFGSEDQLVRAFRTVQQSGLGETLGDATLAATAALRFKDSLTSALLENQQRVRAAAAGSTLGKLASAAEKSRQKLRDLTQTGPSAKALAAAIDAAESDEKALTRKLSRQGQTRSWLKVTPEAVGAALPESAVLVEFTSHAVFAAGAKESEIKQAYTAILIAKGQAPRMIRIGSHDALDASIKALLKTINSPSDTATDDELNSATEKASKALYASLMTPILAALPAGTKTLVLSPDETLNAVPFAALLDEKNHFLCENYELRFVASGRDLLTAAPAKAKSKSCVLLGNPAFGMSASKVTPSRDERLRDVGRGLTFEALPGTAVEVEALSQMFNKAGWEVKTLEGTAATESSITSLHAPRLLHLATHGFFVDPKTAPSALSSSMGTAYSDSMANSGLVLAGGGATTKLWSNGLIPASANDGILTAAEAASLDLEGTELVTLSACDTGRGLSLAGQGVAGLKRALMLSGANHMLTTLWQVNDDETAHFMQAFYKRLLTGTDPGAALAKTQAEELQRLRTSKGLWYATNGAGPFVLTAAGLW